MDRAITFDFWDTIAADDTDEPKRAAMGLQTKLAARRTLFVDEVRTHHPHLPQVQVSAAYETCTTWFRRCWKTEHHTPSVAERLRVGFEALQIGTTPGFDRLVDALEAMEVEIPPDPVPGIAECLQVLHGRYRLGIVSDAIVTPGTGLRRILERWDLLRYFDVFVFSDEVGASKPSPRVFHEAADGFGLSVKALIHVGDREANDIDGPLAVGALAVLYTGAIDRGSDCTRAHAVCTHHDQLPAIVDALLS